MSGGEESVRKKTHTSSTTTQVLNMQAALVPVLGHVTYIRCHYSTVNENAPLHPSQCMIMEEVPSCASPHEQALPPCVYALKKSMHK